MRRTTAWVSLLAGAAMVLHGSGRLLPAPPVSAPSRVVGWVDSQGPGLALFSAVRLAALAVVWYLVAATALALVARASRRRLAVSVARAISVPAVRRMVGGAVGLTLAAGPGMVMASPGGVASEAPGPPAASVVMQRLTDDPPVSAPPPPAPAPVDQEPAAAVRTWEVVPGQHFWAVAELVLAEAWAGPPSDREVDGYWRVLVEANRSVLRDPANPDLLYPGQVLTVPATPPRRS